MKYTQTIIVLQGLKKIYTKPIKPMAIPHKRWFSKPSSIWFGTKAKLPIILLYYR